MMGDGKDGAVAGTAAESMGGAEDAEADEFRSMLAGVGRDVREIKAGGRTMYLMGKDAGKETDGASAQGPLALRVKGEMANELYWVYTACGGDRIIEALMAYFDSDNNADAWPGAASNLKGAWVLRQWTSQVGFRTAARGAPSGQGQGVQEPRPSAPRCAWDLFRCSSRAAFPWPR